MASEEKKEELERRQKEALEAQKKQSQDKQGIVELTEVKIMNKKKITIKRRINSSTGQLIQETRIEEDLPKGPGGGGSDSDNKKPGEKSDGKNPSKNDSGESRKKHPEHLQRKLEQNPPKKDTKEVLKPHPAPEAHVKKDQKTNPSDFETNRIEAPKSSFDPPKPFAIPKPTPN